MIPCTQPLTLSTDRSGQFFCVTQSQYTLAIKKPNIQKYSDSQHALAVAVVDHCITHEQQCLTHKVSQAITGYSKLAQYVTSYRQVAQARASHTANSFPQRRLVRTLHITASASLAYSRSLWQQLGQDTFSAVHRATTHCQSNRPKCNLLAQYNRIIRHAGCSCSCSH